MTKRLFRANYFFNLIIAVSGKVKRLHMIGLGWDKHFTKLSLNDMFYKGLKALILWSSKLSLNATFYKDRIAFGYAISQTLLKQHVL